jgi:hypothetical protein
MAGAGASFGAEINWPLVAGLGVTAAVLFYALYIVNGQLQQADQLVGGTASTLQSIVSPITSATNWISSLFSGDPSGSDN